MAKLPRGGKSITSIPKSILYNRYLLYFVFAIALGNVVQLMTQQDHMSLVIMVVVGLLTSFFSKNMVVILCIALVVTNILKYGTKLRVEGFASEEEGDEDEDEDEEKEEGFEGEGDDDDEEDDEKDETEKPTTESFRKKNK